MPARAKLISMNAPLRKPWTQDQSRLGPYPGRTLRVDGLESVAMTGGTANHSIIMRSHTARSTAASRAPPASISAQTPVSPQSKPGSVTRMLSSPVPSSPGN